MILCGLICIFLAGGWILLRRQPFWQKIRSPCRIIFVFGLMGFLAAAAEKLGPDKLSDGRLLRNEPGEGTFETEAYVCLTEEETEYPVTLSIEERTYRGLEEKRLLAEAVKEIDETFCKDNESLKQIMSDPFVSESYQDGKVSAEWTFSETGIISPEGEIRWQDLNSSRQEIEAFVSLSCGDSEEFYQFSFWIEAKAKSKKEKVISEIKKQLAMQETTEEAVRLPDSINGQKVKWRQAPSTQVFEILGLGILAAIAAAYMAKEQKEKAVKKRKQRLLFVYPEFVSKLSLFLGAGMTISGALRKMNQMYQRKKESTGKEEEVYEELHRMICEMDNGRGEIRAYQNFSEQCDLQPYRKLVSLLIAGQKAGSRKLMEQLNEEADRVFLERKNTARRLGEEAGTKMLFPMMLMLVIVMGIVIIPAFMSVYGI